MPRSSSVLFASSNSHKFSEAREILAALGIDVGHLRCSLEEVQSDSIERIAEAKAEAAFALCGGPVLVEDAALQIDALGGFPGPYSAYVFRTIGNAGILKLLGGSRAATFVSAVSYRDAAGGRTFRAEVAGAIPHEECGSGWGYDPIFMPEGRDTTYAQMAGKNSVSHRYRSLQKFARWFRTQQSSGR